MDCGLFEWAAPNPRGWTTLYVNPGVGTSLFPIRFWDPPRWAEIEIGGRDGDSDDLRLDSIGTDWTDEHW